MIEYYRERIIELAVAKKLFLVGSALTIDVKDGKMAACPPLASCHTGIGHPSHPQCNSSAKRRILFFTFVTENGPCRTSSIYIMERVSRVR
jgi:hypothetical protein